MIATPVWPPPGPYFRDAYAEERALLEAGRFEAALELCAQTAAAAERASAPEGLLAMIWAHRGDILRRQGALAAAVHAYAECLRRLTPIAERIGHPPILAIPLHTLVALHFALRQISEAMALLDQADALSAQAAPPIDMRYINAHALVLRAWGCAAIRDYVTSRACYTRALELCAAAAIQRTDRIYADITHGLAWLEHPNISPPSLFVWDALRPDETATV